jgi:aryl-alcohol dehydrogenase-like predicted oxidoreductase
VSRTGFGAKQLPAGAPVGHPRGSAPAAGVVRRAVELSVTHIDTAQFYGPDTANRGTRDALSPYPDGLVLATKVGAEHRRGSGLVPAQRPDQLRAAVEANLSSLGVDRLDKVNLRRMDQAPGILATGRQLVDLDSQLSELSAMGDEGTVGVIGVSNVSFAQLRQALPVGIACVQNAHSVIDRSDEPLLELCGDHDIAWVPYFPLGSAFPGRAKVPEHPVVVGAVELDVPDMAALHAISP